MPRTSILCGALVLATYVPVLDWAQQKTADDTKEVRFMSSPSGAQIEVNGSIACTTPCSVFFPKHYFQPSGTVRLQHESTPITIRFLKDGYVPKVFELTTGPLGPKKYNSYLIITVNVSARLDVAPSPTPAQERPAVESPAIAATQPKPAPTDELTPQQWFERGFSRQNNGDLDGALHDYDEACQSGNYLRIWPGCRKLNANGRALFANPAPSKRLVESACNH